MRPITIGLCVLLALAHCGCAQRDYGGEVVAAKRRPLEMNIVAMESADPPLPIPFSAYLPLDAAAKIGSTKVFAKYDLSVRNRPSDSAGEAFRIRRGTPMYVQPTDDPDWMRVRLARGRNAFVRTNQTDAALRLALARQRMEDQARLAPRIRPDNEADAGDGRGGSPVVRDQSLLDAIRQATELFAELELSFDQLRAEAAGFQSDSTAWSEVREAVSSELTEFAASLDQFATAVDALAGQSANMSGIDRSAFQLLVAHHAETTTGVQAARTVLNQMTEGLDWTELVAQFQDQINQIGADLSLIETQLNRMA